MDSLAHVLVPPLQDPLTYLIPKELEHTIDIGYRVAVPLGKRKASGYVVARETADTQRLQTAYQIKPVSISQENQPCFAQDQLKFFEWVAEYYGDTVSNVIDVAVPPTTPPREQRTVLLRQQPTERLRGKKQHAVVDLLASAAGGISYESLTRRVPGCAAAIRRLCELGIVEVQSCRDERWQDTAPVPEWASKEVALNQAQQEALQAISAALGATKPHTFLLHGITGSGKTEVYIEAIRTALAQGKGVLVIVPEIALTPQLVDRFRGRLGNAIAVLHSAMPPRQRWESWRALLNQRCFIALGARSAVFAPVPNLGLIIVDEEHDASFKQSEGLRYNARDMAVLRARLHACPAVLGSATPAMESLWNAQQGKYTLLSLPARPSQASGVKIEVVDLNHLKPWEMCSPHVSPPLMQQLQGIIERGEQAFILYNRRGFASYLQCERCEEVLCCPNCSVSLTLHRELRSLLCHYCGLSMHIPEHCPACEKENARLQRRTEPSPLKERGAGTERVFEELQQLFPEAQIARLDRDAASNIEQYRAILDSVRSGTTQILVGTQMIAKGHDLPNVTLVGIVDCDVGLHMPDFRGGEKVYQLLTQAAGRAGRALKGGHVILQTRVPKHPAIMATASQDYSTFAALELRARRALGYPPFSRVLRVIASGAEAQRPGDCLISLRRAAEQWLSNQKVHIEILGPSPCPLTRLKAQWRWHMLVKGRSPSELVRFMKFLLPAERKIPGIKLTLDIDPQEML
ncbi:MAG: primosomal protein N' [Bdellovibrionota bacterium]|nr:MAG: primosomal protein N' [Bdellovibrionota bacterium]